jgi:RNA polymerase sigma factor (sigma-70 family)
MTNKAEKELINLLKKGSRNAFIEIYNIYKDALYSFAVKATNSADDAKDLVQDTFFDLWARNENIDSDTSLKPYLFTSIKNRFLNKIRREKRFDHYANIIFKVLPRI